MKKINVILQGGSYQIIIDVGLFKNLSKIIPLTKNDNVMLVTNENVAPLYSHIVQSQLKEIGISSNKIVLPDGERFKSFETLDQIFTTLLQKSYGRNSTLIALGGGVVGDITGFAAASYQRGIKFIQIPTTLLSQVDASIGGKTAVNHPLGKNMIGAFHQPVAVLINLDCLKTLPDHELSSGLAEVIKYSIIFDKKFFIWLENNIDKLLLLDSEALSYCIYRCCEIKVNIVISDEYEKGIRALLNFGHTYGHAIEACLGYGKWSHGHSISVGMVMAAKTANFLGFLSEHDIKRIRNLLSRAGLPVSGPKEMTPDDYLHYMIRDKKVVSNNIKLILPISLGKAKIQDFVEKRLIIQSIESCMDTL